MITRRYWPAALLLLAVSLKRLLGQHKFNDGDYRPLGDRQSVKRGGIGRKGEQLMNLIGLWLALSSLVSGMRWTKDLRQAAALFGRRRGFVMGNPRPQAGACLGRQCAKVSFETAHSI